MYMMNAIVSNNDPSFSPCEPQPANRDISGQFLGTHNAVDVPICDNPVDYNFNVYF
jgi:hypothetical protein